jgi:hypothetical protein
MICVLCFNDIEHQKDIDGNVFWKIGHNARPIKAGRCCGKCNIKYVIPERLAGIIDAEMEEYVMIKNGVE